MNKPTPPEGYRLAEPGETYYPKEGDKPAYWWAPLQEQWLRWINLSTQDLLAVTAEDGYCDEWNIFAVPLTAMDELVALSQELGLYDMTDNPLVKP
jgi:hypothetical protein